MMGQRSGWVVLVAVAVAMVACDLVESPQIAADWDDVSARALEVNGFRLNGFRLNGFRLNGFRLNGDDGSADFIDLESIELEQGGTVAHSWLEGGELRVELTSGAVLAGDELKGAVLHFGLVDTLGSGSSFKNRMVRIAAVTPPEPGSDVWIYELKVMDVAGPWQPLCVDEYGAATGTILIGAAWDPATGARIEPSPSGVVTLACLDAALGKCAEWGYSPHDLPDHHEACTRLVRADYCGDGVAHTVDGMSIHVLDELGIQEAEPASTYVVEAEWGPDGATCLNAANTRLSAPTLACALPACGEPFASGGLIQTGVVLP